MIIPACASKVNCAILWIKIKESAWDSLHYVTFGPTVQVLYLMGAYCGA